MCFYRFERAALQHLWDARLSQSPCLDVLRTTDLMLILSGLLVCDSSALQNQILFLICFNIIIINLLTFFMKIPENIPNIAFRYISLKECCLLSLQERVIYLSKEWYSILCINFCLSPSVNNATDFTCWVLFCSRFLQSAIWGRIWW